MFLISGFCEDCRTQKMYQLLDPGFVGVILSCFSEDANKVRYSHDCLIGS